jgi:Protein of unknown function (DUF2911)
MYFGPALTLIGLLAGNPMPLPSIAIHPDTACPHRNVPLEGRKSPLDSVSFKVANQTVKVCYGRPSSRGRVMLGGSAVPYGKLWRTGANEPTIFFAPVPLSVAGITVKPGVYSLYTVPGAREWEVIVNRSVSQWGHENQYTDKVKAQEVGRAKVKTERIDKPVETFTIRGQPGGDQAALVLEWEKTRVRIPVQAPGKA